jgi:predicted permease
MVETLIQDVRYAIRLLRRSPVFTLTAALSLAIGIGANTTIFSVASALLLRPLPGLSEPARLVDVGRTRRGQGFDTTSYPNYRDLRERTTTMSGVYAYRGEPEAMALAGPDGAESVYAEGVTGNYFNVLGTRAAAGRMFTDADDEPGRGDVAVISYELWQRRFGGNTGIVGQTVTLSGQPYMVVGIAPDGFQGTTLLRSDLWLPLGRLRPTRPEMFTNRRIVWLIMGGRLKPGVTMQQADAEARAIGETLAREYPNENAERGFRVARSAVVPGRVNFVAAFIGLLMGIVGLVLLIACVNVAGMMLARAAARQREIAVRLAIGAGRSRLVRQLLTESLILFGAGCALGLLISNWLTAVLLALLPQLPMPVGIEMRLDWRALTATIALTLIAAVLSGLAPALQASRPRLVAALRREGMDGPARLRLRNAFVVGQITLALLLVVAAALFLRALNHATSIQPGFDQAGVDVVSTDLALAGYNETVGVAFARTLVERAAALPGVTSVTLATDLPLDGSRMSFGDVRLPGTADEGPRRDRAPADWNVVTPGFFKTMGVRLLRGRDFTDADSPGAPRVAIVNEALARRYWGTDDVIGRQFETTTPFSKGQLITIVGVAANAQFVSLGDSDSPYLYVPLAQQYRSQVSLLVKSATGSVIPQMRTMMHEMNANLPVTSAMPMSEVTAIGLVPQRIAAAVAGSLGLVGLLLAAMGIYGVTAYAVSRWTHEIGIRIALGADGASVLRLVLRQALVLTAIGVTIGLAGAAAVAQLLRSLLFGVSSVDPVAFVGAALLFGATALVASYLPARRATRVDPMVALRNE